MSAEPIWTPLHLRIMLHYYVSPEEFDQPSTTASDYTQHLLANGLLEPEENNKYGGQFKASEKGKAFVQMLCSTPLPEQIWINPMLNP